MHGKTQLMRSRLAQVELGGPFCHSRAVDAPNDTHHKLMATLSFAFQAGTFRFGRLRCDHLAAAANFAKRVVGRPTAKVPS